MLCTFMIILFIFQNYLLGAFKPSCNIFITFADGKTRKQVIRVFYCSIEFYWEVVRLSLLDEKGYQNSFQLSRSLFFVGPFSDR